MFAVIKVICLIVSAWWIIAVLADFLYVIFTHDPTSVSSFLCNPFCIIIFPMLELKMHQGALGWLLGLGVVIVTAIFFI